MVQQATLRVRKSRKILIKVSTQATRFLQTTIKVLVATQVLLASLSVQTIMEASLTAQTIMEASLTAQAIMEVIKVAR